MTRSNAGIADSVAYLGNPRCLRSQKGQEATTPSRRLGRSTFFRTITRAYLSPSSPPFLLHDTLLIGKAYPLLRCLLAVLIAQLPSSFFILLFKQSTPRILSLNWNHWHSHCSRTATFASQLLRSPSPTLLPKGLSLPVSTLPSTLYHVYTTLAFIILFKLHLSSLLEHRDLQPNKQ
jgi:hypothetical protein